MKNKTRFSCTQCGAIYTKWSGKCEECGAWDSVIEEKLGGEFQTYKPKSMNKSTNLVEFVDLSGKSEQEERIIIGISEFDRVLGGGLVFGSAILIGGDPGIGKSTILLQAICQLAKNGHETYYISGEESTEQIKMRASRLGLSQAPLNLASASSVLDIIKTIEKLPRVEVLVIDSIQTMFIEDIASAPGTVSQVRAAAFELIKLAKKRGIALFMVGHITKEGQIAGPKVLEHMVDTVLYFEGERGHNFRILRSVKNRFGAANEIGVFQMTEQGLEEVPNPSALFLAERGGNISGSAVFAGMEGSRPVLVEVQALIASTSMPSPRRAVVGWDLNRLAMITAVLSTRLGIFLGDKEIYLNIAGGLKIQEPAADLAVAAALLSAIANIPLPEDMILFGEIGLLGEIRQVSHADIRLKEAKKLGFQHAVMPNLSKPIKIQDMNIENINNLKALRALLIS